MSTLTPEHVLAELFESDEFQPQRWQPIDTAPSDQDVLLGWWRDWPRRVWKTRVGEAANSRGGWKDGQATHWMPLPSPPEEVSDDQRGAAMTHQRLIDSGFRVVDEKEWQAMMEQREGSQND